MAEWPPCLDCLRIKAGKISAGRHNGLCAIHARMAAKAAERAATPLVTCVRCGEAKQPEEFHVDNRRPTGRAARCKACRAEDNRAARRAREAAFLRTRDAEADNLAEWAARTGTEAAREAAAESLRKAGRRAR